MAQGTPVSPHHLLQNICLLFYYVFFNIGVRVKLVMLGILQAMKFDTICSQRKTRKHFLVSREHGVHGWCAHQLTLWQLIFTSKSSVSRPRPRLVLHEQAALVNLPRAWGAASLGSLDPGQILEIVSSDASTSSSGYSVFMFQQMISLVRWWSPVSIMMGFTLATFSLHP